jgi:cytochrome c
MKAFVIVTAILVPTAIGMFQAAVPAEPRSRLAPPRTAIRVAAGRSVWDSVYTEEQGKRGLALYGAKCTRCHLDTMAGNDDSPPLTGDEFLGHWDGVAVAVLHDQIRVKMPDDDPGTLSRQDVSDIIAYLFTRNGFPAGPTELPIDPDSLKTIQIDAKRK